MQDTKTIQRDIKQLYSLASVSRIYAEVASLRMKRTRESVLLSREFLEEINKLFDDVRASYSQEIKKLQKRGKNKHLTFLSHNGKSVALFLSSNTGLYGDIVSKTFAELQKELHSKSLVERPEVTIVGRQGLAMFQTLEPDSPFTYFDLPDQDIDATQLTDIIRHVVQYDEIHVFYGKYQSVIRQTPEKLDISAQIISDSPTIKPTTQYLFEPEIEKILMFFETEIFTSIFEQTVKESQLARFASRILAMDQASENIKKAVRMLQFQQMQVNRKVTNRKQLNSLSAAYLVNYGQTSQ